MSNNHSTNRMSPTNRATNHATLNNLQQRASTRTIHVSYNSRQTDRASLFLTFRAYDGFDLIGFYDRFCFVRFKTGDSALQAQSLATPFGITTLEIAKQYYEVPYPQPDDDNRAPCKILHITHLPTNYTKIEIEKIFGLFPGFNEAHFYGKYGYAYFENEQNASMARQVLRVETNLVVSFAKSAPKPIVTVADAIAMSEQALSTSPSSTSAPSLISSASTTTSKDEPQSQVAPRFSVIVKKDIASVLLFEDQKQRSSTTFDKFDPTPGAGRPFKASSSSFISDPVTYNQYPDKQKMRQEIFQTLAFGYDWRGGSIGSLVIAQDKRPAFSLEIFKAKEQKPIAVDEGRRTGSWNLFGDK